LPHKKYMIENGFEGIGLALVAVAICLGLACILLVGVGAAVFLALARRSPFSDDDDAGNDRQDYQHAAAAKERAHLRRSRVGPALADAHVKTLREWTETLLGG
jgi:hypothetical protein